MHRYDENRSDVTRKTTPVLSATKKLRVENPIAWDHHRGGWRHVVHLVTENLHAPDGVRFVSAVEDELHYNGPIREPWVGFLHQVPRQNLGFPDLERLLRKSAWRESVQHCLGIWVLCDYYKRYLISESVEFPVAKVHYPTSQPALRFSYARFLRNAKKKLLFIGEFLRQYQPFYDLNADGFEKVLLKHRFLETHMRRQFVDVNDSVRIQDAVSDLEYDELLSRNLVFLNLYDAGANTTVVECIASGTPILINNVGGVSEYLGKDYPFYYSSLSEASRKLNDLELIRTTADYLKQAEIRNHLTDASFLAALQNTTIYRSLPTPRSQEARFKRFDVSVIVCSYKRVYNIARLLNLLSEQEFDGTFEVLLWNNNMQAAAEIARICRQFERRLSLKYIHSSENFYCIIRMAMASLIRSDLLLICDDDVLPSRDYIATFVKRYKEYGPEAALCARGHVFFPHDVNEENPEQFWAKGDAMRFYDEKHPDLQVHFMHADNALIPKYIMNRALQYEMDRYEFALVDDYWLSFVLSHHMKVPIWKIKADQAIQFTDCSDDPKIALFHNDLVKEQRVNFYIYHMRRQWPPTKWK